MTTKAVRQALRLHRLERNLTYDALAADIAHVLGRQKQISLVTIKRFIDGEIQNPRETTLYTFEQYLKAQGVAA